ncbi:porin [Agrobacterium vitis]|uniref:porin n=1 Tax=Rhizobium/Agrobacterium group TaxID=227290 RepID=UPI0008FBA2D4|nr:MULTISPECIES: porin [Rhizobium/Agrobacterium group]MCF1434427.1 porin [Allorhizobium ampelinum]MCF1448181.1 porin [Allorhizobium ampelinum]MCF1492143.1 porin [Allorhizobium ampelinum]MUO89420.1 porin [Agrobacterium vitis]MUZ51562.1 porin [Agrobacterium vitis]
MNIKSLLLGSAAALAAVSGAQAADAIVAAAPEPAEYVRVCDAFGTGYFYIPGTETCLRVKGYVRFEVQGNSNDGDSSWSGNRDWNARTRGLVTFDAKNDSEIGTIGSTITVRTWADENGGSLELDEAFITVAGFQVGSFYNYFDTGLSGETDDLGSNRLNSIAYNYKSDTFFAGIAVDELTGYYSRSRDLSQADAYGQNKRVGIEGQVGGSFGPVTATLLGGWDAVANDGAVRLLATANLGPGVLGVAGLYSTGVSAYYDKAEWTVAAEYAAKITDKLTLTPGVQYFANTQVDGSGDYTGRDIWKGGLTLDYKLAEGLTTKVSAQYQDHAWSNSDDVWSGFVRLQRSF